MTTTNTLQLAGLNNERVDVTSAHVDELESRIRGALIRPGDNGWDAAIRIWNGMAQVTPALVIQPVSATDVVSAVRFARHFKLLLSVKGGGHHIAGTSIAGGGLTLDMSRMRDIVVDPQARLANVGPGCQLKDVDAATQQHGLATVLGFISEVGVAGLTLGGGLGYLTRRFGWAVDNLEEAEVVTADGVVRTANRQLHPDLFWALRGAGANFGVVTRFTFRLHEVGPRVYGGLIAWPFDRADEILHTYRRLTGAAARELSAWMVLLRAPSAPFVPPAWHEKRICAMAICYSGDLDQVGSALAPIRALGDPVIDLLQEMPYGQIQSYLDGVEPKGCHYYWRTDYVTQLNDELLVTVRDLFASCPIPEADIGFLHLEGAVNERSPDDGAVGNRDVRYAVGIKGMWQATDPRADAFRQWVRDASARIRPYTTGGSYINFQTADEGDNRVRATYGANYERLVTIKKKYDPENLFRCNRNVAPK